MLLPHKYVPLINVVYFSCSQTFHKWDNITNITCFWCSTSSMSMRSFPFIRTSWFLHAGVSWPCKKNRLTENQVCLSLNLPTHAKVFSNFLIIYTISSVVFLLLCPLLCLELWGFLHFFWPVLWVDCMEDFLFLSLLMTLRTLPMRTIWNFILQRNGACFTIDLPFYWLVQVNVLHTNFRSVVCCQYLWANFFSLLMATFD